MPNSGRPGQSWGCLIRVHTGKLKGEVGAGSLKKMFGPEEQGVRRRIPGLVNCIGEERVCVGAVCQVEQG